VRYLAVAVLTGALAWGAASSASAAGVLIHENVPGPYGGLVGPALAGDSGAWTRSRPGGYDIVAQPLDGSPRHSTFVHATPEGNAGTLISFDASAERWALALYAEQSCVTDDGCKDVLWFPPVYSAVVTAPFGQDPAAVERCDSYERCGKAGVCMATAVHVAGNAIAYPDNTYGPKGYCGTAGVVVRDLAPGRAEHRFYECAADQPVAIAGGHARVRCDGRRPRP
jgi:hypothetical protein